MLTPPHTMTLFSCINPPSKIGAPSMTTVPPLWIKPRYAQYNSYLEVSQLLLRDVEQYQYQFADFYAFFGINLIKMLTSPLKEWSIL